MDDGGPDPVFRRAGLDLLPVSQDVAFGGLLARVANGSYVLGPRIPELDRTMRLCDPVYIAGSPVIQQLTEETGHSSLLCILFSESIMCVQQALGKHAPPELFSRGQRRPLVAGASAKIILAYLPLHQLRVIFTKHRKSIAAVGLGADWERFKQALKQIRQAEYAMTTGSTTRASCPSPRLCSTARAMCWAAWRSPRRRRMWTPSRSAPSPSA